MFCVNANGIVAATPPFYTTPAEEMPVAYGLDWIFKKQHQLNQVQALSCVELLNQHTLPGSEADLKLTEAFKNYGLELYSKDRGLPQPAFNDDSLVIRKVSELHCLNKDMFIIFDRFVIAEALKIQAPVTIFDYFVKDCLEQGLVPTLQYGAFKNKDLSQFEPAL